MKKKHSATSKDKKDWDFFTKKMGKISDKESVLFNENIQINKTRKLDLHGCTLQEANDKVKNFIIESFDIGYKKLIVITGKGLRSKTFNNPYLSAKLSTLKHSVPEYIKNDESLSRRIIKISEADLKDGGSGAIYIFLRNNKKLQNKF